MAILTLAGVCHAPTVDLRSADWLRSWLPQLAERIGMHPVGEVVIQPYAHWPDGAPSGVLFIEESALIVHCYPEKDYIELILHSCKAIPNRVDVAIGIIKDLKLTLKYHRYESAMDWRVLANGAAYQALLWPDAIRMASYHGAG